MNEAVRYYMEQHYMTQEEAEKQVAEDMARERARVAAAAAMQASQRRMQQAAIERAAVAAQRADDPTAGFSLSIDGHASTGPGPQEDVWAPHPRGTPRPTRSQVPAQSPVQQFLSVLAGRKRDPKNVW